MVRSLLGELLASERRANAAAIPPTPRSNVLGGLSSPRPIASAPSASRGGVKRPDDAAAGGGAAAGENGPGGSSEVLAVKKQSYLPRGTKGGLVRRACHVAKGSEEGMPRDQGK